MRTRLSLLIDGCVHRMERLFMSSKSDVEDMRIMLFPKERVAFVRKYYYPVSKVYAPKFTQDVVDMAFEAFILGFVDKLELVTLMRKIDAEIKSEDELPF